MALPRFVLGVVLVAVTLALVVPGPWGTVAHASPPAAPAAVPGPAPQASPAAGARILEIEQTLRADHVPARDIHLPDLRAADPGRLGAVAPTYGSAPAPMGLADLGLTNVSGNLTPSVLDTTSVEGRASFATARSVYVDGDGPDMFGVQLNAVATNVTLFGHARYEFWAQDFFSYTSSNGTLTFGDNLWNMSNPAGLMSANALYDHGPNGSLVAPVFYYATGPTFTVHYPFVVTFFLNATTVANRPAIFFNFTLAAANLTANGTFDDVVFNSSFLPPVLPAAVPEFQANGTGVDPLGLPNDLELVLVGNDDGDTTTFYALQATFFLATWNGTAGAYDPIPSAFDAGSDTGETSDGVGVYYNTAAAGAVIPDAVLAVGPSFVGGLWNYSNDPGYRTLTSNVAPTNSFLLVTPGAAYNASEAQWAPTFGVPTAPATITFPNTGAYYFGWFLSDYRPVHRVLDPAGNSTTRVTSTLVRTNSLGVYTPLLAWGNAELAAISTAGNGTAAAPYLIEANEYHAIDPVFGAMNDFLFPVFPGILLVGVDAFVHLTPPSLALDYSADVAANLSAYGLPVSNHLQIELWNVSNVTVSAAASITGWLSADLGFFPVGALILWGSSGNLIAGNTFNDQGIAVALYGGTNNTIWGNSFLYATAAATNESGLENSGNNTTGLFESESGDLVYNNYFALPAPAYTPTIDPLSCQIACLPVSYADRWNVSYAAANATATVLGTVLTGSIIGTSYQGGNYWSNYGMPSNPFGVLPYNDSGRITNGGDYVPLVLTTVYPVSVNELGLAPGTTWGVEVQGVAYRTNGSGLTLYAPNGTFNFTVLLPTNYTAPASGNFTVNGSGTEVTIAFSPLVALVFEEAGLVVGWSWNVTVNTTAAVGFNLTENSTGGAVVFEVVPGTYQFQANSTGYNATPANGSLTVTTTGGGPVVVQFSLAPAAVFQETGLPAGTAWTVEIMNGTFEVNYSATTPVLTLSIFELPPGPYDWNVSAAGYSADPASGGGNASAPAVVPVAFTVVNGTLAGVVSVAAAYVYVNGNLVHLSAGAFSVAEAPGIYAIVAVAAGYVTYYNNVTVTSGATTTVPITLTAVPTAPSGGPGGISDLGWGIIVALAVVAAIGLLLAARSRRGKAPPPVAPYSGTAAPAAAAAPAARPPWEEDAADTSVEPPKLPPK